MSPTQASLEHHQQRQELAAATARQAGRLWGQVDPQDVRGSWGELVAQLVTLLSGAQQTAAQQSEPWLQRTMGSRLPPAQGQLSPQSLSGIASDGRSLAPMLMYPGWAMLAAIARGASLATGLAAGRAMVDLLVRTQVADAGRAADSVAMVARPGIMGHERVVPLPACSRCIVLAGRLYRWSEGFQRHPRCDCTMEPVTEDEWHTERVDNTPANLFAQMSPAEQERVFTTAGAQAIRDGADLGQVVNARRGMRTATAYGRQVQATTEGTTRRGLYGRYRIGEDGSLRQRQGSELTRRPGQRLRTARTPRLMPEEIYRQADDREHAIHLLRTHGYLR